MRAVSFCTLVVASLVMSAVSTAHAGPIVLASLGGTNAANVSIIPNGSMLDLTFPSATWQQTTEAIPNNVGLTSSTQILFAGASLTTSGTGDPSAFVFYSLVTFTTPSGSFSFDSDSEASGLVPGSNPPTDAQYMTRFLGTLTGGGFDPTPAVVYVFFNANGTYGNAAYGMAAYSNSAVPEPSSLILTGLGAVGLMWQVRRRWANG